MNKGNPLPRPRPNTSTPLGLRPGKGPAAPKDPVKVTDNAQGWASVANIPVPPAAERRNFLKPLGLGPVLVNGGSVALPADKNASLENMSDNLPLKDPVEPKGSQGLSFNSSRLAQPKAEMKTVEIDWYGARLSIKCLTAIRQRPELTTGNQAWLMLELPLDPHTGNPAWLPPIAQLGEDGRIQAPEFDCVVDSEKLRCQILNIGLHDKPGGRYIAVFRVLK